MKKNNCLLNYMRLDKWLYCSRFFKTRKLSSDMIKKGKVIVNKNNAKSSKMIKINDILNINLNKYFITIKIIKLSKYRLSFIESQNLYLESLDSIDKRIKQNVINKYKLQLEPRPTNQPDKRSRKKLIYIKRQI